MSQNQPSLLDFDENFFSSIAVPKTKDYSRLSSSPSRDQPCDSSYFEKHFPKIECDTPVKMRLPQAVRESDDALPAPSMDILSSSSSSDNTAVESKQREPLKVVPNVESDLIEGISKLAMFGAKEPELRLSQRRRSEQKKKQEEENKRRSAVTATSGTSASRARSASVRRSVTREPSATRTTPGVVTRSMARAAETTAKQPPVRRSVMPVRIAQKTPVAAVRDAVADDRSRDRTRRTNTTGSRRSVVKPSTPVAPPRRSGSAQRTTPANRPIATANRSSMLRMSASKAATTAEAPAKPAAVISRPIANGVRNRVPLRVNPATPSAQPKKPVVPTSGPRPVRPAAPPVRAQSVERATKPTAATPSKATRDDFFSRLSLPKKAATPSRPADETANSSIRKSAVRPVPSYIRSVTKDGLPSSAGLHGIRAPSKTRESSKSTQAQ